MIVTVSCPYRGRIEIEASEVLYEPNGDGTAIYEFGCEPCGRDHMRHATIADVNQYRICGVRKVSDSNLLERFDLMDQEAQVAAFVLELTVEDDIVGRLS